ncbi:phosphate ABC transporter substrate-binding protein PstS [Skermania sp. ID1734]|uniref:phosphate ABC transporter substrate-binding protein PstS n=1 Tax=Skermania sp. ID1734 TaxID=2597516 RepID=UPI00118152BF|nr:phosphate ABC transporter substrate-binding protein PstS [Skermania sp. ID1734]TSD96562.1 phosphate ABC transporter substrate-binding protein PstS [Skermania sp. ID1734]
MNLKRSSAVLGVVAIGAVALSACGTDNNTNSAGASSAVANSTASCEGKARLSGAGSSAQKNAMDAFTAAYIAACSNKGKTVNVAYNPSGSGDGRTQFIAKQIDFAGSDSAIKDEQAAQAKARCGGNDAWNIPLVFGPVALAYHLDGVDNLVLNGEVAAKIFNGAIKKWNDPAIAALNHGVALPDQNITVFFRSDSSGTTDNFQQFLAAASHGAWTQGAGSDFRGGTGQGAKGSAGVAQGVATTPGSITYVEKSFADQNKLTAARLDSGSGPVALSTASASKAIDAAQFKNPNGNDLALDLKSTYTSKEPGVYPLILATYEVVCSKGYDPDTATAVKSFLTSAVNEGQSGLADLGYVPLPQHFKEKVAASINAMG